jgi:hypothetical protein
MRDDCPPSVDVYSAGVIMLEMAASYFQSTPVTLDEEDLIQDGLSELRKSDSDTVR